MTQDIKDWGEHFHPTLRIYNQVLADISRERPLTGEGYRILLHLLGSVGSRNKVPAPSETAKVLKLDRSNAHRHYRQMVYDGYLVKDEDGYRIHPFICWRGSENKREDEIAKLLIGSIRQSEAETEEYIIKRGVLG